MWLSIRIAGQPVKFICVIDVTMLDIFGIDTPQVWEMSLHVLE
jgi:hypothetical protein